jgi:uncharacterized membrane protein SirB2
MYALIKHLHMGFAALSISGFLLRGYWHMTGSALHRARMTRIAPHVVDTLFLGSGIWLLFLLHLNPLQQPWLLAKFTGLLAYIGLGMIAFRFGRSREQRLLAFVAALAVFGYIVGAALAKSVLSWFAW